MKLAFFQLLSFALVICTTSADDLGGCRKGWDYRREPEGVDVSDVDSFGGGNVDQIDKIIQIVVESGCTDVFCGLYTVRRMIVTYRMITGETRERIIGEKDDGPDKETITFAEGQYLVGMETLQGRFIDHVTFFRSNGIRTGGSNINAIEQFGPIGGKLSQAPNNVFKPDHVNAVIKAFSHQSGDLVHKLGVHFKTYQIYARVVDSVVASELKPTETDRVVLAPDNSVTNNNGSTEPQTIVETRKQIVTNSETNTLSTSSTIDVGVTWGASVTGGGPGLMVETNIQYSVGASFTNTEETSKEVKETFEISRDVTVVAPPCTKVTALVTFTSVSYDLAYTGPVDCIYTFDTGLKIRGDFVSGTIAGVGNVEDFETSFDDEELYNGSCGTDDEPELPDGTDVGAGTGPGTTDVGSASDLDIASHAAAPNVDLCSKIIVVFFSAFIFYFN